ncbi:YciI family protein [Dietzia aurantiaca]|uniref:YciI family protein n=1 Tax=Dietzia aurantiaca TaxID=983873 RepID=A0ABV9PSQ0_9ACTN
MRYSLIFHAPELDESGPRPTDEQIAEMQQLMNDYVTALTDAGVLISAEMLEPTSATTTVTRRTGSTVIEDGPFAEVKESLAGVFVLEVAGHDAALAWAEKFPGGSYGVVEIRPVAVFADHNGWQTPCSPE